MDHKISIIIPIYGVESYIEDCLKSVVSQDYKGPLECILVDDRGPDKSMDVVNRFISCYDGRIDFKTIIREKNGGLSAARNSGLKIATGEYVYFLDSDDEITPNCISELAKPLFNSPYDIIVGDYITVGTKKQFQKLKLEDNAILVGHEILKEYMSHSWYQMAVNKLYRTEFLRKNNMQFEEGLIHEDELWSFQIACLAESLYSVKEDLYIYKIRENSITTNINYGKKANAFERIYKQGCKLIKNKGLNKSYYAYLWASYMFGLAIKNTTLANPLTRKQMYLKLKKDNVFSLIDILSLRPMAVMHIVPRLYITFPYFIGNICLKRLQM